MKCNLIVAVLTMLMHGAEAADSPNVYTDYFDDFWSDSKTIFSPQYGQRVSDIALGAGLYGANAGALSPFLINKLSLSVGFKSFKFDVPAPFYAGVEPAAATFTVGGSINFQRNNVALPYSPLRFSFNVQAVCADGYCHDAQAPGQLLGGALFSKSRTGPEPFFPYDFSVAVDTLSSAGANYYPAALAGTSLELDYKYSALLQIRKMSDLTKASGWSFEQAGRTELARRAALDDLLSTAGSVKSAYAVRKYLNNGKISDEGINELKSGLDVGRKLDSVRADLNNVISPTPTMDTQAYALDTLSRTFGLGGDALAGAMLGGPAGRLEALRAANLTGMSLNLGVASVGGWVSRDPPDMNYKASTELEEQLGAMIRLEELWGQAEDRGLLDETYEPLRKMFQLTSFHGLILASAGVSFERYMGAFISRDLEWANGLYASYRGASGQLPQLAAEYSQAWDLAVRELSQTEMPSLTLDEINGAREVILAAIEYERAKGSISRVAGKDSALDELTALLARVDALQPSSFQGLTFADVLLPNYGQIALDRFAVTSVPEAPTWIMLLIGALVIYFKARTGSTASLIALARV